MQASAVHIVGVLEGEEGSLEAEDAEKVRAAIKTIRANAWMDVAGELGKHRNGDSSLVTAAAGQRSVSQEHMLCLLTTSAPHDHGARFIHPA